MQELRPEVPGTPSFSEKKILQNVSTRVLNLFYARTEHSLRLIYVILTRRLSSFQKLDPFKKKKFVSLAAAAF